MNTHNTNSSDNYNITIQDRKSAIGKFLYELKFRKKEFLNECVKYDFDFSSRIKKIHFEAILNKFTCYLTKTEKEILLTNFVVNDTYVNYKEISNSNILEEYTYKDSLLTHLNILKEEFGLKNISLNIKRISQIIKINPLDLLNFQISEENFLISIAKKIMDYIITNSDRNMINDYFYNLAKKFDFDFDDKFAIGEINNFLLNLGMNLSDSDLRFLYESFELEGGKFSIQNFRNYVCNESNKNYGLIIDSKFIKNQKGIFTEEEIKEESRMEKIFNSNYFLHIIKESLQICGKSFLYQFFSKYIQLIDNNFFIDLTWLEVGYKKLGYKVISQEDVGNFKYFLVKKSIGTMNHEMNLKINLERLFNYLINEFQLKESINQFESSFVIKEISTKILDDITDNILSYGIDKKENNKFSSIVDEYEFRKNIVSCFSFMDHNILDYLIKMLKSENSTNSNSCNKDLLKVIDENKNKTFSIESIESRKWLHLIYNFLFMGLIKHSDEFGLKLDELEKVQLNNIYINLENKIFQKEIITEKSIKILNINESNFVMCEDKNNLMKEPLNFEKTKIEENSRIIKNIEGKENGIKRNMKIESSDDSYNDDDSFNYSKIRITNSVTRIKENYYNTKQEANKLIHKENQFRSKKEKNNSKVCDTVNLIPELFELCSAYIKRKLKIDKISPRIISDLGCCQVFRDHLTDNQIDLKKELNFNLFLMNIRSTPNISDSLYKFLEFVSSKYKSINNLINPLYFFSKLEEILIQYSKINLGNMNYDKYTNMIEK